MAKKVSKSKSPAKKIQKPTTKPTKKAPPSRPASLKKAPVSKSSSKPSSKAPAKPAPKKPEPAKKAPPKPAAKKAAPVKVAAKPAPQSAPKVPAKKAPAPAPAPAKAASNAKAPVGAKPVNGAKPKINKEALIRETAHAHKEAHKNDGTQGKKTRNVSIFTMEDVREILRRRGAKGEAPAAAGKQTAPAKGGASPAAKKVEPVVEVKPRNSHHAAASLADILGITAPVVTKNGSLTPSYADREVPAKFKKYHKMLVDMRRQVSEGLSIHTEETLKRSPKEDSGDISTSPEAGTDNFDRDFALSLVAGEQELLAEIDAALERVFAGTYGVCEITGDKIDPDRLDARPFTRYSVAGQRQHESTVRRRRNSGSGVFGEGDVTFGEDDGEA